MSAQGPTATAAARGSAPAYRRTAKMFGEPGPGGPSGAVGLPVDSAPGPREWFPRAQGQGLLVWRLGARRSDQSRRSE